MKNSSIYIRTSLILLICILTVLIITFSKSCNKNAENDFLTKEKSDLGLKHNVDEPTCFCINSDGNFVIGTRTSINTISPNGQLKNSMKMEDRVTALCASKEGLYVAAGSSILLIKQDCTISIFSDLGSNSIVKSIRKIGNTLYVSDAGNKLLYTFSNQGKLIKIYSFEEPPALQIVSAWFDFVVLPDSSFWMTNPGNHQMDLYSKDGEFLRSIPDSENTKLFEGCCNPLMLEHVDENKLVSWEKGEKRVRMFDFNGNVLEELFVDSHFHKELYVLDMTYQNGVLYLLDSYRIYTLKVER